MKISTRGRYALRMLVDLARTQGDGYVSLTEIAERLDTSKKYLEQIVSILTREGYLQTTRGFKGGYRLARAASTYRVGDVLRATEGSIAPVACADCDAKSAVACPRCEECATHRVWKKLAELVSDYLDGLTVQDLVDGKADIDRSELYFEDGAGV